MNESKWIPVNERLPNPNEPFWTHWTGSGYHPVTLNPGIRSNPRMFFSEHPNVTHWQPIQEPAPPVIKSPAELAWEKRYPQVSAGSVVHSYFLAGFEDGLSEGRKG